MKNFRETDNVPQWPIDEHIVVSFGETERIIDPISAIIQVSKSLQDKVWSCGMVMAIDPSIRRIDFEWPATIVTGKIYNKPLFKPDAEAINEWVGSGANEAIAEEHLISVFSELSLLLNFNSIWFSLTKSGEHIATSLHCSVGGIFNYCTPFITCLEGPVIWQNKELDTDYPETENYDDIPF